MREAQGMGINARAANELIRSDLWQQMNTAFKLRLYARKE